MTDILYIEGKGFEVLPNVFVEDGTILYPKCSRQGRMQQLAFNWAFIYAGSIKNYDQSVELLKKCSYENSALFYPSSFGYVTTQAGIALDVKGFSTGYKECTVWFPKNAWSFDTVEKCGIVGGNAKEAEYFHFTVEVQFRQTSNSSVKACTNDCWSFYTNKHIDKFYQVKEWLDGRVRRLQAENVNNTPTLILDVNNINLIPWPPIYPGKEDCINPVTTKSGCVV
jgi:hypothetical protein